MRFRYLAIFVSVVFFISISFVATAKEGIPFNKAPQFVQEATVGALKTINLQPNDKTLISITKDDCPDDCKDSIGGGFCYCTVTPCPDGTEEIPTEPGRCRVRAETAQVFGEGLSESLKVKIPLH